MMSHFSLALFKMFLSCVLTMICLHVDLRIFPTWNLLRFLDVLIKGFFESTFGNFSGIISLNISSVPISLSSPADTPITHKLVYSKVSHVSLRLCLFPLCFIDCIISINLASSSLVLSSASSNTYYYFIDEKINIRI